MAKAAKAAIVEEVDATEAEVVDLEARRVRLHREGVERARELMVEGHEEAALDCCLSALRLHASYEGLSLAGTLLALVGDPEESVRYTRSAIDIAPEQPDAYYDLASTLLDLGRPGEALDWIDAGIARLGERRDDLADFLYGARVEALVALGRYDEAELSLAEGYERSNDPLHLLEGAEDLLEAHRRRPQLQVI